MKVLCCRFCQHWIEVLDWNQARCDNTNLRLGIGVCGLIRKIDNPRKLNYNEFICRPASDDDPTFESDKKAVRCSDDFACENAVPRTKVWWEGKFIDIMDVPNERKPKRSVDIYGIPV